MLCISLTAISSMNLFTVPSLLTRYCSLLLLRVTSSVDISYAMPEKYFTFSFIEPISLRPYDSSLYPHIQNTQDYPENF